MTNTTKYVKPVYPFTKLKPVPASSELAFNSHYFEAHNRPTERFNGAVKQFETKKKVQETIVPHKVTSGSFDPIEESLFWLTLVAAVVAGILLCVIAL